MEYLFRAYGTPLFFCGYFSTDLSCLRDFKTLCVIASLRLEIYFPGNSIEKTVSLPTTDRTLSFPL